MARSKEEIARFCRLWQTKSMDEVTSELGITRGAAKVFACTLRAKGVNLRMMPVGNVNVEELNAMIDEIAK